MDVLTDGYALPVSGGLYPPPPYLYRGATAIIASYEADPAAIAGLLPPGVSPLEDPPVCLAWVVHYPFSTLGVYNEAIMLVRVSFEGEPYTFCPFIYVDNDAALACGRELWGFPKKFASMGYAQARSRRAVLRADGVHGRAARREAAADRGHEPRTPGGTGGGELPARAHPAPDPEQPPRRQSSEHLRADQDRLLGSSAISAAGTPELWTGRCSVTMDSASEFDPLVAMAPVRTLGALYAVADITLPLGTPVKDYLAEAEVAEQPAFT